MIIYFDNSKYAYTDYTYEDALFVVDQMIAEHGEKTWEIVPA